MRVHHLGVLLLAGLVLAPAAAAQEPMGIVFGAYYSCDQSREAQADTVYLETAAAAWQKQVDAGLLTTAGWSRHWAGGEWRRLGYVVGTDLDAMIQAREAYIEEMTSEHPREVAEFNAICPSHDDYIWFVNVASTAPEELVRERPAAGLTSYMECDSREAQADAIVETAFAAILNGHVAAGQIDSWSWLEHFIGGKYRRALVMDATDTPYSIIGARSGTASRPSSPSCWRRSRRSATRTATTSGICP
jgi:hypothetical protein